MKMLFSSLCLVAAGFLTNAVSAQQSGGMPSSPVPKEAVRKSIRPVYEEIFSFTDARTKRVLDFSDDGGEPCSGLVQGVDGSFYGTTSVGGKNGCGTIFKVTPAGVMTTLLDFTGKKGKNPGSDATGDLLLGSDGNFYGSTTGGGGNDCGTIFKMTPGGNLTTLVEFTGDGEKNKGRAPKAGLVMGKYGSFFGVTSGGGKSGDGTVFKMTPAGDLETLVEFANEKGAAPEGALVLGDDGNFYGTTKSGGRDDFGTVFRMTPVGKLETLVEFSGIVGKNRGSSPGARLVQGKNGDFFGTTREGGKNDYGTVFMVTPRGNLTTLVEFSGNGAKNKGINPRAGLVLGSDGSLYGTTYRGGDSDNGTVFKLVPGEGKQSLETLVEFTFSGLNNRGAFPVSRLLLGSDGNFFGTTRQGGSNNSGTVFKMSSSGELQTLVQLTANQSHKDSGTLPFAGLVIGADGNYYGMARSGGKFKLGTIFRMSPGGVLSTVVNFTGKRGGNPGGKPVANLILGKDGNFYGCTSGGGEDGYGTVFSLKNEKLETIVEFSGKKGKSIGSVPMAALVEGSPGAFFGTTSRGGASDHGTVFMITQQHKLVTLVEFTGQFGKNPGDAPVGALVRGKDGNFYGTTSAGGAHNFGTIFKMTPKGALETLVHFTGDESNPKGGTPLAGLARDEDGNFFGTTSSGGKNGFGTIFSMTPKGTLKTLVDFTGKEGVSKGSAPMAVLLRRNEDGNFYGTTSTGGSDDLGTVFKITPSGGFMSLASFTDQETDHKGGIPLAGLAISVNGNFFGTTSAGGAFSKGTVFKMTPAGVLTTVVEFTGGGAANKGSIAATGLAAGDDGKFYGTTRNGGTFDNGTVFQITSGGVLTTLVEFIGNGIKGSGRHPVSDLLRVLDPEENFYGTTKVGGSSNCGTIFKMTPGGEVTTKVEFSGTEGGFRGDHPSAGLIEGMDGNFYGMTRSGGKNNCGTIYRLSPEGNLETLFDFTDGPGNAGHTPMAQLVQGRNGFLYGTTSAGGRSKCGTIFRMAPEGAPEPLVHFTGNGDRNKGRAPLSGLVFGENGDLYGTTSAGGKSGKGTIFRMSPAGGPIKTLVNFTGTHPENPGSHPAASLVHGPDGNFYGTTKHGGESDNGTVFKMTPSGDLTTLVDFVDSEEGQPTAPLINGVDGNLYGTIFGPDGAVYRLVFPGKPLVTDSNANLQNNSGVIVETRINPRGLSTTVWLEYGTDGVDFPNSVRVAIDLKGSQTKLVGTTLSTLVPQEIYHYRFRAKSTAGETFGPVGTFSPLAVARVTCDPASDIQKNSAEFNGTVNPQNYDSMVYFEWGTDGNNFPNTQPVRGSSVIKGDQDQKVGATVASLDGGTTYYYRLVATNSNGTAVSGTQSFKIPVECQTTTGSAIVQRSNTVILYGLVDANGTDTDVTFEHRLDTEENWHSDPADPDKATGDGERQVSVILDNLRQGSKYFYRVVGSNAAGRVESSPKMFKLDELSGLKQHFPDAPDSAQGYIVVNLKPSGVAGGWRFAGEQTWRPSGVPVGGLEQSDRVVEFMPVNGYIHPRAEPVGIISGGAATVLEGKYRITEKEPKGSLKVALKPTDLADSTRPKEDRAQWRLFKPGTNDDPWIDSDAPLTGLFPGTYLVECKPVAGRSTPPLATVVVTGNDKKASHITITYFLKNEKVGAGPLALPFETVSGNDELPYCYVGQIRSDVGSSSGFVVKPRVVVTAGHVVFDDGTLSYTPGLQWLFQRDSANYEPKPLIPRGAHLLDDYAASRTKESVPGKGTPESQNRDAATLFFNQNAGRGGYSGYLASDSEENEFLISREFKTLIGYPVDGEEFVSGRMHATSPANIEFKRVKDKEFGNPFRTYITEDIHGSGGMSGGPLCVEYDGSEGKNYYPAAIYIGGDNQTIVRAIDSKVIDIIKRAEVSSAAGDNNTNAGYTLTSYATAGGNKNSGAIKVSIEPRNSNVITASARWILLGSDEPEPKISGVTLQSLSASKTKYSLKLTEVPGFERPEKQNVEIIAGKTLKVVYQYLPLQRGSAAPEIVVLDRDGSSLRDNAASRSFGSVSVGKSKSRTFTLKNTGKANLTRLAISKNGENKNDFRVNGPDETALAPGARTTFSVTFKPSAKGERNAAIHIRSNDGDENPFDIRLTGKGVAKASASGAAWEEWAGLSAFRGAPGIAMLYPDNPPVTTTVESADGYKYLALSVWKFPGELYPQRTVEVSSDLVDWFSGTDHTTVILDNNSILKVRDNSPITPESKRFIRLKEQRHSGMIPE